ncbi:ATP-binding cassette sub-family A member 8 [Myotis brandtii]|uniref:ATP-binding cassette sub-family A member 8 n=1 Tax=Myotis brandtii TaxID=109478 RepID=S7P482_MYOBR|nr:ATP-binding cassette sub-family A member 8 [Myotis brandtii]
MSKRERSVCQQTWALLCKNLLRKWRMKRESLMEWLSLLLLLLSLYLYPIRHEVTDFSSLPTMDLGRVDSFNLSTFMIAYTPLTNITQQIMKKVALASLINVAHCTILGTRLPTASAGAGRDCSAPPGAALLPPEAGGSHADSMGGGRESSHFCWSMEGLVQIPWEAVLREAGPPSPLRACTQLQRLQASPLSLSVSVLARAASKPSRSGSRATGMAASGSRGCRLACCPAFRSNVCPTSQHGSVVEHQPMKQEVTVRLPGQGTCPGCGFNPQCET